MIWEIVSSGGLVHGWPTPNNWNRNEEKEEDIPFLYL